MAKESHGDYVDVKLVSYSFFRDLVKVPNV